MKEMAQELVKEGYKPTDIAKALDISRTNCYDKEPNVLREEIPENAHIVGHIKSIGGEHPFWGYRRITAWLRHKEGHVVNRKKVYNLMKKNNLLVPHRVHRAKRAPNRSKPKAVKPRQYWGIDMTKFMVTLIGWVYLVIVLDWFTKKIVGYSISTRCRTREWKEAIEMAVERECPNGSREEGISLISDNGSQPTSTSFIKDMATLGIKQIFTSYDNPKGNAETERSIRTIKEEIIWMNEFNSLTDTKEKISFGIENKYNRNYPHSALGYMSPCEFEKIYLEMIKSTDIENRGYIDAYLGLDRAFKHKLEAKFEDKFDVKAEIHENLNFNNVY
jgi:transposase InsO family protein